MVTYGGLSNGSMIQSAIMEDAISNAGYALTPGSTAPSGQNPGSVKLAGSSDDVVGLAFASTKDRQTEVAGTNVLIGVIPLIPGLEVQVPLVSDNQAISYGEKLAVTTDTGQKGKFDRFDATGTNTGLTVFLVANGTALQNAGGFILARVITQIEPGQLAEGVVSEGYIADNAVGADKLNYTIKAVTVTAGQTSGTATVTAGSVILGYYPTSNQDQFVDSIVISSTTLTVTLAAAATANNVFAVVVLEPST